MIWILTGCLLILVILIAFVIKVQLRKKEINKYYVAAQRIIQEQCLNYSIKNPMNSKIGQPQTQKIMLCLKAEKAKNKGFVFDPEDKVYIGRTNNDNSICLQDVTVSGKHCCLYLYGNEVWLQDLNSANGTFVKRGLEKPYFLQGSQMQIASGDKICVGKTVFKAELFFCDLLSV